MSARSRLGQPLLQKVTDGGKHQASFNINKENKLTRAEEGIFGNLSIMGGGRRGALYACC